MNARELVRQAEILLGSEFDAEERLRRMEEYVNEFEAWYRREEPRLRTELTVEEADTVRVLLERHEQLMSEVLSMQSETSARMRQFRERAKAIMAYAGSMPSRMNLGKVRKG